MNAKLNVGIIGAGRIGKVHAETLAFRLPEANPANIADVNLDAARAVAERCGIPRVAASAAEIFADPAIEAVLICSSTATHARYIVEAAQAGKHIFCEKPIDHSLDRIDEALEAVESAGVKLQIGFNRRFDANFARVRTAVVRGEIGTPQLLHIVSRDPAPPPFRLRRGLRRHVPRYDDSRFRHGALPYRRRSGGDLHRRRGDGGPGNRRGGRSRYGGNHASLPQRSHRHDRQQPEGRIWVRSASRSLR